ncbi:hypothetical protein ACQ4PT_003692 [Festuca glaucescens]
MEKKLPLQLALAHGGEGLWTRPWRWAKTAFFLVSMLASLLLVCAPPLLIVLLDLLLPPALLSNFLRDAAASSAHTHTHSLLDQARGFGFRSSLVDLPAVSAARSLLILCAYTACGGGAAYLWVAAACSVGSLLYVLAKAVAVFGLATDGTSLQLQGNGQLIAVQAMFLMSLALAAAHLAMAYRASSRERRRLHVVYRIDIEAVSPLSPVLVHHTLLFCPYRLSHPTLSRSVRLKGAHTPKSLKQCIV